MIIGHLPAGYLAATGLNRLLPARALFLGLVLGSILPDLDILWFYLVDAKSTHHHDYLLHRPILWLGVLSLGLILKRRFLTGVGLGSLLHMVLDTTLGQIAWGWPLTDSYTTFITIASTHDHWLLSFMAHWTFKIELALAAAAAIVFWRRNRKPLP